MSYYTSKEQILKPRCWVHLIALGLLALFVAACSSPPILSYERSNAVSHFLIIQNKTSQRMRNIEVVYGKLKFDRPMISSGGSLGHGYDVPVADQVQISWLSDSGQARTVQLPVKGKVTNWREINAIKFVFDANQIQVIETYVAGDPNLYNFSNKVIHEQQY